MNHKNEIFNQAGEALYYAQILELYVTTLISVLNERFNTKIDVDKIIINDDKATLGKLINNLKSQGSLDNTGSMILQEALERRNYIIHHFFKENIYALTEEAVLKSAHTKLVNDTKTIAKAVGIIQCFIESFCESFKIQLGDILVKQDT